LQIELSYNDRSEMHSDKSLAVNLFASVTVPDGQSGEQKWTVVLPAALFRILNLRRNAVIDLRARATIRSEFGRWLHGFFSTQTPGLERRFDAIALCAAGGISCARPADTVKRLRAVVGMLSIGKVLSAGQTKLFAPIVNKDWRVEVGRESGYVLVASRVERSESEDAA
jgi:hypothetical protein